LAAITEGFYEMSRFAHRILILTGIVLGLGTGGAVAQDNRDAGKKPSELFANDCSGCHKSPAGLSKGSGMFGLESFLREHYTASKQSAALIAGYLRSVDAEQQAAPAAKRRAAPSKPKSDKPAADTKKPDAKADAKPETKADAKREAKPASEKPADSKPAASKPAEAKPAETKPPADIPPPAATQEKSN
jgi:hypothetical protein